MNRQTVHAGADLQTNEEYYGNLYGFSDNCKKLHFAFLIYQLIRVIRKNNSVRVARGIVLILVMLWLSGILRLTMINYLLRRAVELGLIAILILFQPELRRLLEKIGSSRFRSIFGGDFSTLHMEGAITQSVLACADMSRSHTGALIIFERDNQLTDPISTGTIIDAEVTAELLKNIFFVKAPLHDGAVIIKDGRIAAAGCMLPMSANMNLSRDLGMRHRAGIGMSERSDAVVLIVSEETGRVSYAYMGELTTGVTPSELREQLHYVQQNSMKDRNENNRFRIWKVRDK